MRAIAVIFILASALLSCADQPKAGEDWQQPKYKHAEADTQACSQCHEKDRPADYLNTKHGGGKDCAVCHVPKDDTTLLSEFLPRREYSHVPAPTGCLDCHIKERSTEPAHPKTGDCVTCHRYPSFNPPITGG